jgi:endoglucanase
VTIRRRLSLSIPKRALAAAAVTAVAGGLGAGSAQAATRVAVSADAVPHVTSSVFSFANTDGYQASENVGQYPLTITRTNPTYPGVICWGVTNKTTQAGHNFDKVNKEHVQFAAGQSTATVYITIHDQHINGPAKYARAYMYGCGDGDTTDTPNETITLLQNDPLDTRDPTNVLGYGVSTNGDPLQNVDWYVFGKQIAAGQAAQRYKHSKPSWSKAFSLLADTPGSGSWRFWMWSQPIKSIATTVEKWFADAQLAQPNTTVQLTMYNLVHGNIAPSKIKSRYEKWITQFARGLGNNRAVIYLEEDALITMPRVAPAQRKIREQEIAYAVKALEADPHVLVYIDAGASDTLATPADVAKLLKKSDIAQANGFSVNTTHHMWLTTEINWGQKIAKMTNGSHFIVQSGSAGRGPHLNPHPKTQGIEDLCNPPGTGLGPLTWTTGYKYTDGLLWYANVGFSANIPCHDGAPGLATFWPSYAYGIISRRVNHITGPKVPLIKSKTDM